MDQVRHAKFTAQPIETAEVEPGDALRARVHFLVAQHNAMVVQTQFADAKAAALMTLSGVAALRAPIPESLGVLELALLTCLVLTVLLCLWAIIPRFGEPRDARDRFTWLGLTSDRHGDLFEFSRNGPFPELLDALTASNRGGAAVLRKKFRCIRWAFLLAILSVLLVVIIAIRNAGVLPLPWTGGT